MADLNNIAAPPTVPVLAQLPPNGESPYQRQRSANPTIFDPQEVTMSSSKYDQGLIANPDDMVNSIKEHRGQKQPWEAQLGAGIAKGVVMAGTTFVDSFVGLGAGIVTEGLHLVGQTDKGFNDNPVLNAL